MEHVAARRASRRATCARTVENVSTLSRADFSRAQRIARKPRNYADFKAMRDDAVHASARAARPRAAVHCAIRPACARRCNFFCASTRFEPLRRLARRDRAPCGCARRAPDGRAAHAAV